MSMAMRVDHSNAWFWCRDGEPIRLLNGYSTMSVSAYRKAAKTLAGLAPINLKRKRISSVISSTTMNQCKKSFSLPMANLTVRASSRASTPSPSSSWRTVSLPASTGTGVGAGCTGGSGLSWSGSIGVGSLKGLGILLSSIKLIDLAKDAKPFHVVGPRFSCSDYNMNSPFRATSNNAEILRCAQDDMPFDWQPGACHPERSEGSPFISDFSAVSVTRHHPPVSRACTGLTAPAG